MGVSSFRVVWVGHRTHGMDYQAACRNAGDGFGRAISFRIVKGGYNRSAQGVFKLIEANAVSRSFRIIAGAILVVFNKIIRGKFGRGVDADTLAGGSIQMRDYFCRIPFAQQ